VLIDQQLRGTKDVGVVDHEAITAEHESAPK
jgi:hypothetical protein